MSKGNSAIIYDVEILKCIPGEVQEPELEYCEGWRDFQGMGISCIGVYDYQDDRYRVFLRDNLDEFQALAKARHYVVGFNSLAFDDKLCAANGIEIKTTYDLLVEVRRAAGEPLDWNPERSTPGLSLKLENLAQANLGYGKSGNGADAPALWQRGQHGEVIDYCLQDVQITRKLLEKGCDKYGGLVNLKIEAQLGRHALPDEAWRLRPCAALEKDPPFYRKVREG